jgi:hypothetical protein
MTEAERKKAWRDRKRGGPPQPEAYSEARVRQWRDPERRAKLIAGISAAWTPERRLRMSQMKRRGRAPAWVPTDLLDDWKDFASAFGEGEASRRVARLVECLEQEE